MAYLVKGFIIELLFITPIIAQNLVVNDFGGKDKSFFVQSSFVDDVHTISPTNKNGAVDIEDLNNALEKNRVILENSNGDIHFALGLFQPSHSNSSLVLKAKNNVHISFNVESTALIDIEIWAGGDVLITGPGVNTNGGVFKSNGQKIRISNSGLKTKGGELIICHLDSIIIEGEGINTSGGDMSLDGSFLDISNDGVHLNNGTGTITCTDDIRIMGNGINARNVSSSGRNFMVNSQGMRVIDHIILHHKGNIVISGGGIRTNGGNFQSYGAKDIDVLNMGLKTAGGNVLIDHTGNITISGEGIETDGGDLMLKGNAALIGVVNNQGSSGIQTQNGEIEMILFAKVIVRGNGIYSGEGDISILCDGDIDVAQGGISSNNGDIYVESKSIIKLDGFNLNSNNGVKIGQGKLDTSKVLPNSILFLTEPVVGGGDVTIKTSQ